MVKCRFDLWQFFTYQKKGWEGGRGGKGGNLLCTGLCASQCSCPALRLLCKSSWVATCNVPLLCGCDSRHQLPAHSRLQVGGPFKHMMDITVITVNLVWWMKTDINSPLSSISVFSTDLKSTQHSLFWDFSAAEQLKPLQPVGQAAEFNFESKSKSLQVICKSLPKAIPEDNQRFWLQNQWTSSWGRAPAQLGLVWHRAGHEP